MPSACGSSGGHFRQGDLEGRATTRFAIHFDRAFVAADDTEADGQAHAGAGFALGGEEWIEESLFNFGPHAGTGVGDMDDHAVAVFLGGNSHFAAGWHGVDGVVDHVYQYFAEFDRVAFDVSLAVGVQGEANGGEFRARFPARARHFAGVFEQFGEATVSNSRLGRWRAKS